jgi:MerR family mercuric resistance operon transcriptional regulator
MSGSKYFRHHRARQAIVALYDHTHLRILAFVRRSRELGFSIDQVRALLRLGAPEKASCRQVRDIAARHLGEIRTKIADLHKMEKLLAKTVAQCTGTTTYPAKLLVKWSVKSRR